MPRFFGNEEPGLIFVRVLRCNRKIPALILDVIDRFSNSINSLFMQLDERRILVVGGAEGIGLAASALFVAEGAQVIVASRSRIKLDTAVATLGGRATPECVDIDDECSISSLFARVGHFDHLVVTARRRVPPTCFRETPCDCAMQAFDTKFWGQFRLAQHACEFLRDGGSITLSSGTAGARAYPGHSVNAAINGATEALARTLAVELAPIRVNVVSPCFADDGTNSPQRLSGALTLLGRIPSGRLATCAEIARAYLFLVLNDAVSGTVLVVDGGASC